MNRRNFVALSVLMCPVVISATFAVWYGLTLVSLRGTWVFVGSPRTNPNIVNFYLSDKGTGRAQIVYSPNEASIFNESDFQYFDGHISLLSQTANKNIMLIESTDSDTIGAIGTFERKGKSQALVHLRNPNITVRLRRRNPWEGWLDERE